MHATISNDQLAARLSDVVRFTVPFWSKVAIVDGRAVPNIEFHGRSVFDVSLDAQGDHELDGQQAIDRLEELRISEQVEFLIVPAPSSSWMQDRPDFEQYMMRMFRRAVEEDGIGTVFALTDEDYNPPDGLPLPTREMIALVGGRAQPGRFFRSGVETATWIRDTLARHGADVSALDSLLDFGCGCGRTVRQWKDLDHVRVFGSDYNPYLIRWCQENLRFATFKVNGLEPPLDFPAETFDLLYSISIFTHLDEHLQTVWMDELHRVIRPGGYLLFTVSGAHLLKYLDQRPAERERFLNGEFVAFRAEHSGTSSCECYHPEEYLRGTLLKDWEILEIASGAAVEMGGQDVILARRP